MRQLHCIHCGIIIKGNFRGKNEFVRYPKGLLHESCKTKYDIQMRNKDKAQYMRQYRRVNNKYTERNRENMRQYYHRVKVKTL